MFISGRYRLNSTGPFLNAEEGGGGSGGGTTTTEKDADQRGKSGGGKEFTPITSQEDLDDIITRRLRRHEKKVADDLRAEIAEELANEAKAKEAAEQGDYKAQLEAANKDIEKLKGKLAEYEAKEAEEERTTLRRKIAKQYKLPDDDDALLLITGDTEEDMKKSAKVLAKFAKIDEEVPDGDQGRSTNNKKQEREKRAYDDPNYWGITR